MQVQDSEGRKWEILPGDPAWNLASGLARRGFTSVTLPVGTIRTGENPRVDTTRILAILEQYTKTSDGVRHVLRPAFLAACTLYDCTKGAYELGLIEDGEMNDEEEADAGTNTT